MMNSTWPKKAFLTGTAAEVTPVREVTTGSSVPENPAPITLKLQTRSLTSSRARTARYQGVADLYLKNSFR